jgi:hypothetical protein
MRLLPVLLLACAPTSDQLPPPTTPTLDLQVSSVVPGQRMVATVQGAQAGAVVYLGVSFRAPAAGPCLPIAGNVCLLLDAPILLGSDRADAQGNATFVRDIPSNLALGRGLTFQAVAIQGPLGADSEVSDTRRQVVGGGTVPPPACDTDIGPCWDGCTDMGWPHADCLQTCDVLDATGCYRGCEADGIAAATCTGLCGIGTEQQEAACHDLCLAQGVGFNDCNATCGSATTCGEYGCFEVAEATFWDPITAANQCGVSTPCGQVGCYELCGATSFAPTTCRAVCGLDVGVCDAITLSKTPAEACVEGCIGPNWSESDCETLCR